MCLLLTCTEVWVSLVQLEVHEVEGEGKTWHWCVSHFRFQVAELVGIVVADCDAVGINKTDLTTCLQWHCTHVHQAKSGDIIDASPHIVTSS